jgi:hypothetical protein
MGGRSKRDDIFIIIVVGLRKYVQYFFVMSTQNTTDKKTTNGNRHAMLKVIQHGVTITQY